MSEVNSQQNEKQDNEKREANKAEKIISLVMSVAKLELFHDEFGDPYAKFPVRESLITGPVNGKAFRRFVSHLVYKTLKHPVSRDVLERVIATLEAKASFDGPEQSLSVRVARQNDEFWYDLGHAAVRITAGDWHREDNPPNIFHRYSVMKRQVTPTTGGVLKSILKFVNVTPGDQELLFLTFLVAALIPDIPHPILAIHGPQGSAKTSLVRVLISIIDPAVTEDTQIYDFKEMQQAVSHRWLVPFDNLGSVKSEFSNFLCKLVTGYGFSKRELYTNDDDVIKQMRRVVVLNGVNMPLDKPDVLDRCVILDLARVPEEKRRDEHALNAEFEMIKGKLFGACLDTLVKAMGIYPTVSFAKKPRMADFAKWACAISVALGYSQEDFLKAFAGNVESQTAEALDASPLASVIMEFFSSHKSFHGTMTALLKDLKPLYERRDWNERRFLPQTIRQLVRKLQEITPNLQVVGFRVERRRDKERTISITAPLVSEFDVGDVVTSKLNGSSRRYDVADIEFPNFLPPAGSSAGGDL